MISKVVYLFSFIKNIANAVVVDLRAIYSRLSI